MSGRATAPPAVPDPAALHHPGTTEAALLALTEPSLDAVRRRLVELVADRTGAGAVVLLRVAAAGRRPEILAQVGLGGAAGLLPASLDLAATPADLELIGAVQARVSAQRPGGGALSQLLRAHGLATAVAAGLGPHGLDHLLIAARASGRASTSTLNLVRGVAAVLASAEWQHRLSDIAGRRLRQQASVAALSQTALGSEDLAELSQAACVAVHTNLDTSLVAVTERSGDGLIIRAGVGLEPTLAVGTELELAETFSGSVMRDGEPLVLADIAADPAYRRMFLSRLFGSGSLLVVPIQSYRRGIGTVTVLSTTVNAFSEDDVSYVRSIANVVALAAERARVQGQLRLSVDELRKGAEDRRHLLAHIVQAQEDERRRIADDIHDDSVQVMTAVALRLATLRRRLGAEHPDPLLVNLEHDVRQSIARLRRLMFVLRPPALENQGIVAALHAFLAQVTEEAAIGYSLEDRLDHEPDTDVRIVVYRIAQEAVSNVCKHARASRIDVSLAEADGGVVVTVRDDGVGFDAAKPHAAPPGHLGLMVMRERAEQGGGWCTVESRPGEGTTVRYCVRMSAPPRPRSAAGPAVAVVR